MNNNEDYAIVSGPMIYFDENGDWGQGVSVPNPEKKDFLHGTPFCHAPCMVRAEAYKVVNGYSENVKTLRAEDYDLWFRMYELGFKGHNLSEPIVFNKINPVDIIGWLEKINTSLGSGKNYETI